MRNSYYKESIQRQPKSNRIFNDSDSEVPLEKLSSHESMAKECRRKIQKYQQELRSREPHFSGQSCEESELSSGNECLHGERPALRGIKIKGSAISSKGEIGDIDSRLQELQSFLRAARQGLQQTMRP